jgi:LacI family transcriptional regulator
VPADLSLIGFDDVNEASVVLPRLTTVRAPMRQMAREAVRMLLKRLEDPQADMRSVTLATQLIVRESTAEPPGNLS